MPLDDLARLLSDRSRPGLTPELCERLKIRPEAATRGQLMALEDDERGHLGVYLLGAYVIDDTDAWGDGEVYWFAIPSLVDRSGKATFSELSGIPTGAPPHKVGSLEWMTSLSLKSPPLLAAIPPDDDLAACVIRIGVYDDDGAPADVPKAVGAGLEVLAGMSRDPLSGPDQVIMPVRDAILKALKADDDDILIDQDLTLRRGEATRFAAGFIGSDINAKVRVYYFVRDERKTEQAGPFLMHRGQVETVRFSKKLAPGGRLSVFSRGADVNVTGLGTLSTDVPFYNRVLDVGMVASLKDGMLLNATGASKAIAFYTPP